MAIYYKVLRDEVLQLYFIGSFFLWLEKPRKSPQISETAPKWVMLTLKWILLFKKEGFSPNVNDAYLKMSNSDPKIGDPYPKMNFTVQKWGILPPRWVMLISECYVFQKRVMLPQKNDGTQTGQPIPKMSDSPSKSVMLTLKYLLQKGGILPQKEWCSPKRSDPPQNR